jgi:hypothetical protein
MTLMRRPPHCGHIMRSLRSEIGNCGHGSRPASQGSALHVVALAGRVCLIDSSVDAFRMDAPSCGQGVAESLDGHENN